jgi:hypothetical protein
VEYYRYDDGPYWEGEGEPTALWLKTFQVLKETPCGVWIKFPERDRYTYTPMEYIEGKRFIIERSLWYKTTTKKRYAWTTKKEALASYIYRKEYQISALEGQLAIAKENLEMAREMESVPLK